MLMCDAMSKVDLPALEEDRCGLKGIERAVSSTSFLLVLTLTGLEVSGLR